jgi:hypothetical protein
MNVPTDGEQDKDAELSRASAELDHTREQFVVSMSALEGEVTRTLDWRQWVRRKPGLAVALAFGLGFLLGRRS